MNHRNMKRLLTLAGMAWFLTQGLLAQTIVKPSVKTKTTFAIVTDSKSYEEAKSEIVRAKHILVTFDGKESKEAALAIAEEVYGKVLAGGDFDALIAQYNEDIWKL